MDFQREEDGVSKKIYNRGSFHHKDICKWRIDNEPYDVTIRCGTSIIGAHNISSGEFTSMIDFAYTGKIEVDKNNVLSVLFAADYLVSNELKHFCEKFLIEQLGVSNAFNFRYFGQFLQLVQLVSEADKLIARKFVETTFHKDFLSLSKEDIVSLVSRSDLQVKREEYVFDAITRWINHDFMNRNQYIFDLLQQVKLILIKPSYLANVVYRYQACVSSNKCQQLINQVSRSNLEVADFDAKGVKPRGFREGDILLYGCEETLANVWFVSSNAVCDGKLYETGGRTVDTLDCRNVVEVFSLSDNKSELLSSMNYNRAEHGSCAHSGELYVCGGKDGEASTCCEKLNFQDGKWKFVADMKIPRSDFCVVSCGSFIWAFGGENDEYEELNSTEYYDEFDDEWTLSTPMIKKRISAAAVCFRDSIFVIGGFNDDEWVLNSTEVFDINTKQFTLLKENMTTPRYGLAAAISGYKLYCFGGRDRDIRKTKAVESFNIYTETWQKEEDTDLYIHYAVTIYQ